MINKYYLEIYLLIIIDTFVFVLTYNETNRRIFFVRSSI